MNKLEVWRRLKVREVWMHHRETKTEASLMSGGLLNDGGPRAAVSVARELGVEPEGQDERLRVFVLRASGEAYDQQERSALLPTLDLGLLSQFVAIRSQLLAVKSFCAALRDRRRIGAPDTLNYWGNQSISGVKKGAFRGVEMVDPKRAFASLWNVHGIDFAARRRPCSIERPR